MPKRIACLLVFLASAACAQPVATPQFEVASIRPSAAPNGDSSGGKTGHGQLNMNNMTLKRLIMGAYMIGPNQVFSGPSWLESDRFDIRAKADSDVDDSVLMKMLQSLLAERFKLAIHKDTKTIQAYVLEVGKNGSKMKKSESAESSTHGSRGKLEVTGTTMKTFAEVLARQMDLPVVNQTGLEGTFDFTLEWTPENNKSSGDAGPSIFTAIQEQLGLRMRAQKAPVEVLVIDHAEKPTEN